MTAAYIIAALAALLLVYAVMLAPGRYPGDAPEALWRARYAHRGLHDKANTLPENSLPAFAAAIEAGYGIELDITLTADGEVAVFHDDSLKRMCGVSRAVADCVWAELQRCRLAGTEHGIPRFSEMLRLVDGRVPLIVELKNTKRNAALCQKAAALLDAYEGPYCIESFHPGIVAWFRKHRPGVVRGQLATGCRDYGGRPAWQGMLLAALLANIASRPHFVAFRHEYARGRFKLWLYRLLGGRLVGWTVRDTDDIAWCERFFDAIIFEYFRP